MMLLRRYRVNILEYPGLIYTFRFFPQVFHCVPTIICETVQSIAWQKRVMSVTFRVTSRDICVANAVFFVYNPHAIPLFVDIVVSHYLLVFKIRILSQHWNTPNESKCNLKIEKQALEIKRYCRNVCNFIHHVMMKRISCSPSPPGR